MDEVLTFFKKLGIAIIVVILIVTITPWGRSWWNNKMSEVQKADDATSYETKKEVEDTCRTLVTSYYQDINIYNGYKDSQESAARAYAGQALTRANNTAIKYNEYILKNSYVFDGNIPEDLEAELPILTFGD